MKALAGTGAVDAVRRRNPWSGGNVWARTLSARMYALALGERWLKPPVRFVIVTAGRTGSDLLADLLNSHPDVVCESEILYQRRLLPERYVAGRAARAGLLGARAYGFKLASGHGGHQPRAGSPPTWPTPAMKARDRLLDQMAEDGAHVIFLRRNNHLAQAVSLMLAEQTRWHWRRDEGATFAPATLDVVHLLALTYFFEDTDNYLASMVAPLPHVRLVYEEDLIDAEAQQATVDLVCSHLGLPKAPASSDLVRLTPRRLEETIANFAEVEALFGRTRFGRYLHE
jgi:LPS sulfotransferase NodH